MKVKELIRQLSFYDPEARVYLDSYMGEGVREVLCTVSYAHDKKTVILEDADQFDVGNEIAEMLMAFSDGDWDETDAYGTMVDRGYTPDVVEEYCGKEQADVMRLYCDEHAIEY